MDGEDSINVTLAIDSAHKMVPSAHSLFIYNIFFVKSFIFMLSSVVKNEKLLFCCLVVTFSAFKLNSLSWNSCLCIVGQFVLFDL